MQSITLNPQSIIRSLRSLNKPGDVASTLNLPSVVFMCFICTNIMALSCILIYKCCSYLKSRVRSVSTQTETEQQNIDMQSAINMHNEGKAICAALSIKYPNLQQYISASEESISVMLNLLTKKLSAEIRHSTLHLSLKRRVSHILAKGIAEKGSFLFRVVAEQLHDFMDQNNSLTESQDNLLKFLHKTTETTPTFAYLEFLAEENDIIQIKATLDSIKNDIKSGRFIKLLLQSKSFSKLKRIQSINSGLIIDHSHWKKFLDMPQPISIVDLIQTDAVQACIKREFKETVAYQPGSFEHKFIKTIWKPIAFSPMPYVYEHNKSILLAPQTIPWFIRSLLDIDALDENNSQNKKLAMLNALLNGYEEMVIETKTIPEKLANTIRGVDLILPKLYCKHAVYAIVKEILPKLSELGHAEKLTLTMLKEIVPVYEFLFFINKITEDDSSAEKEGGKIKTFTDVFKQLYSLFNEIPRDEKEKISLILSSQTVANMEVGIKSIKSIMRSIIGFENKSIMSTTLRILHSTVSSLFTVVNINPVDYSIFRKKLRSLFDQLEEDIAKTLYSTKNDEVSEHPIYITYQMRQNREDPIKKILMPYRKAKEKSLNILQRILRIEKLDKMLSCTKSINSFAFLIFIFSETNKSQALASINDSIQTLSTNQNLLFHAM